MYVRASSVVGINSFLITWMLLSKAHHSNSFISREARQCEVKRNGKPYKCCVPTEGRLCLRNNEHFGFPVTFFQSTAQGTPKVHWNSFDFSFVRFLQNVCYSDIHFILELKKIHKWKLQTIIVENNKSRRFWILLCRNRKHFVNFCQKRILF